LAKYWGTPYYGAFAANIAEERERELTDDPTVSIKKHGKRPAVDGDSSQVTPITKRPRLNHSRMK
jgi:hypothetical protein